MCQFPLPALSILTQQTDQRTIFIVTYVCMVHTIFREVGPKSRVWCEKEMVEQAAWDFSEVSKSNIYINSYTGYIF